MKRAIAVCLATLMVAPPGFAAPATTTANVNMRTGPTTSASIMTTIPEGTSVDLKDCDESGAWCSVSFNGTDGFVSGQYLQESEDPDGWPRKFSTQGGGTLILYQPQVTEWDNFKTIDALSAAEYAKAEFQNPVFGVIGFKGDTTADSVSGDVVISDITVTELNFSALNRDDLSALSVAVGQLLPTGPLTIAQERLTASLAESKRVADVEGLKADAPTVFVSQTPAILVQTNGEATMAPVEGTDALQFVVNSNWDILQTTADKIFYLRDEESWLASGELKDGWQAATTLPEAMSALPDDDNWKAARAAIPAKPFPNGAPKVFYSDAPAELIVFDGPPKLEDVPGTALQWASNTENDVFFETSSQTWYLLLSGRWFKSASLDGPWTFTTPDLPSDFQKIPADTPYYSVRYSVPGTSESDEARLKASIPHTARVEIGSVTPDVSYGGDPDFKPIEGTSVSYATNTNDQVLLVDGKYYVLEEGVWFVGDTPNGPFTVVSEVPEAIYTIPPTSSVYNVTYVRVYRTEPGAVWFGYTMGYLAGYLAWGTYVYGTGWRYPPYWGPVGRYGWRGYYPRPVTYGLGAYYNPARGVYGRYGYAYGPYRGIAAGSAYNPRTGRYVRGAAVSGPRGTRGFVAAYNPRTNTGAIARGGHNVYGSWGTAGVKRGSEWARVSGVSSNAGGRGVRWDRASGNQGFLGETRRGNVYAGRDGNVYRNTGDGWQKFNNGGWSPVDPPRADNLRNPDRRPGATRDRNRPATADRRPQGNRPQANRPAQNRPAQTRERRANRPAQNRPAANRAQRAPSHVARDRRARQAGNQRRLQTRNYNRAPQRQVRRDRGGRNLGGRRGGRRR